MIADSIAHRHYHHLYAKIVNYVIDFLVERNTINFSLYTTIFVITADRNTEDGGRSIMEG